MRKNKKIEENVHLSVCKYLDLQYNNVIYLSDSSGIKFTIGQAVKLKKLRCKKYLIPDLIILQPNKNYKGLVIEIKKDRNEIYTKTNELRQDVHTIEQNKTLERLKELGYMALFGCGFDECKNIIDNYLK